MKIVRGGGGGGGGDKEGLFILPLDFLSICEECVRGVR